MSDERLQTLSGLELADRYRLGDFHAAGAFCVVYRAHDKELKRPVAVKVATLAQAAVYREALNATAGLSYPTFLATYDVIEQDDRLFLVHEFVEGRPLSAYLADGIPVRRGVALALQLARAVAYAHQHDLAHGDLTPAAILIDRGAVAHINNVQMPPDWDYFSAIAASAERSGVARPADETLAALRADERLRDVWSVAAALWQLISRATGEPETTDGATPRAFGDEVGADLRDLLARTLDVAHQQRIATAEALALTLDVKDEAFTRAANPQRDTLPLAIGAFREARAEREAEHEAEARRKSMATGRRRSIGRYGEHTPEAPTYSGMTDPMALDTSATRPADDGLYAGAPFAQSRPYSTYDRGGAARGERMRRQDRAPDPNPAWPMEAMAGGVAGQVMRPWVWALIGIVLFTAFFLIGYLVFPQVKLF